MSLIKRIESGIGSGLENAGPVSRLPSAAAVLMPITKHTSTPQLILTRRADHLKNHSGEVAFPGGKWEEQDIDLAGTALRETEEEIGLSRHRVELKGMLSQRMSRWGVLVTPYVGLVESDISLTANPNEIDEIFMVPMDYFFSTPPDRKEVFNKQRNLHFESPVWRHQGFEIWGLTALFILDLLKELESA